MIRGVALALLLIPGPVAAATPADCDTLVSGVRALTGLDLEAPPAPMDGDWCVLDGTRVAASGAVRIMVARLRLRGSAEAGALQSLEVESEGVRMAPGLRDREMPDWLRDLSRLQTADLRLDLHRDAAADLLRLHEFRLDLSGGSALVLEAEVAGAELESGAVFAGRLTRLRAEWKSDGRTMRPVLAAWGERLEPGAAGTRAADAAREALSALAGALPEAAVPEAAREGLRAAIRALPQGRGRLVVDLVSDRGIGAADLGMLALARDPAGPEALARFLAGSRLDIDWQPGIVP